MSTASRNCRNHVQRLRASGFNAPRASGSRREDPRILRSARLGWLNNLSGKLWTPCDLRLCKNDPQAKTAAFQGRALSLTKQTPNFSSICRLESQGGDIPSTFFLQPAEGTAMKYPDNSKNIRRRSNPPAAPPRPYFSTAPWAGFTRHDRPRQKPLPSCPSLRCRRAKACLAAHDNLYCQRTHFSPAVAEKWLRRDPRRRELDAVPPVMDPDSLSERMERINELAAVRRAQTAKMTARWKAGEFDALYGPYRARGVLLSPPPKTYVEGPSKRRAKGAGQGRAGDV